MFGWDVDDDGVLTITMDDPDQGTNTMNATFITQFGPLLDRLEAELHSFFGVILTSAKSSFFAGGDLHLLMAAGPQDVDRIADWLDSCKALLRRLETLGRPVVAALGGSALGGGMEIALACHHRIAVDAPGARFGLPEVTFGLLPGAGGVTRTVRMFGVQRAVQEVLLPGRRFTPAAALRAGLVDEVVADRETMMSAARAWILANPYAAQPWDAPGYRIPGGTPADPALAAVLPAVGASVRRQTRGVPNSAPRNLAAAAVEGAQVDLATASRVETQYVTELICGQISTNMIKALFFDMREVSAGASRPGDTPVSTVRQVAVIGAGTMGVGIAYVCARAGIQVRLRDLDLATAEQGKAHARRLLDAAVAKGRSTAQQRDAILDRILPTTSLAHLAGSDLVIEAVFENADLKRTVLAQAEKVVEPGALLSSNTSMLPVTELATAVTRPEDLLGLHFFSPVDRMSLLEIVVGDKTSPVALARAVDFARQIGKVPIVVNDSRGFFTSRVIGKFLDEGMAMVGEGIPPATVEQAAAQAGYPMGALALMDDLTLTLPREIREETRLGVEAGGGVWSPHPAEAVLDRMIDELGRTGRSGGRGFYDYDGGRRTGLWPGLGDAFGRTRTSTPLAELSERMLFAQSIDAIRCLEEGVLRTVAEANVGSILGIGFPAWTGGVLQYVDQYAGGLAGFTRRARELADRHGERFEPPELLLDLARKGRPVGEA